MSQIIIERARRGRDRRFAYPVDIDGEQRGTLRRGEKLSIDVAPGRHQVRLRAAQTGSHTVEVDVPVNGLVHLFAKPTTAWKTGPRVARWMLSGTASLRKDRFFGPDSWLGTDGYIDLDVISPATS